MLYRNVFNQKDRQELKDLLFNHQEMNFNAKAALLEVVLTKEHFTSNYAEQIEQLKREIESERGGIESFEYLKYLGLRMEQDGDRIKITRLSRFFLVDIVGVLLGTFVTSFAFFAWNQWVVIFKDGLSVMTLVWASLSTIIAVFGLILMVRSLLRYIDFLGFEIVKSKDGLIIRKRNDLFIESVLVNESKLELLEEDKSLSMVYHNESGKPITLISTHGGIKVRETLVQLKNLLSK